jgi:hypothetical protein
MVENIRGAGQMVNMKALIGVLGITTILTFAAWAFVDMAQRESQESVFEAASKPIESSGLEHFGNGTERY